MDPFEDPQPSTSRGFIERIEDDNRRKNRVYARNINELLRRHKRLTLDRVAISTREGRIPKIPHGTLLRTVVRFHVSVQNKLSILRNLFFDLFREHSESSHEGFEVVVTFNAILENQVIFLFCMKKLLL